MATPPNADFELAQARGIDPSIVTGYRLQRLQGGIDYRKKKGALSYTPEGLKRMAQILDAAGLPLMEPEKKEGAGAAPARPEERDVIVHSKRQNPRFLQVRDGTVLFDCEVRNNTEGVLKPGSAIRVRDTGRPQALKWACITPSFNTIPL